MINLIRQTPFLIKVLLRLNYIDIDIFTNEVGLFYKTKRRAF